ncbi:MAG: gliding motility-associated C-terminal domain-containing protein [Bacteroidetes bacterium]|nr:gliding motility-associated C-terminal domain-containing protein [Bacteroidota bacterium]
MQRILLAILLLIPFGVFAQLTIEANTNAGCAPFGVIISVSSPAPASINNYAWSITYPDNTIETASSAEYIDILSIPGDYTVNLTINNGAESITESNFITVYDLPEVNFEVDDYRFEIFNRWGEMIFASETPGEGWNGNVKGGEHYAMDGGVHLSPCPS